MARPAPLDAATAGRLVASSSARMVAAAEHPSVFTAEQCDRVVALRESLGHDVAQVEPRAAGGRVVQRTGRDTDRTHVVHTPQTAWIYARLGEIVDEINGQTWKLKLSHVEPLQLLTYRQGQHYGWHADLGTTGVMSMRKLSLTVQLSDPGDFDGGALQLLAGGRTLQPKLKRGSAVAFPAWQPHRVTAVTRGVRHVLVAWVIGSRPLR